MKAFKNVNKESGEVQYYLKDDGSIVKPGTAQEELLLHDDTVTVVSNLTEEEESRIQFKNNRKETVNTLTVEYKEHIYQADEKSQDRLSRYVNVLHSNDVVVWTTADNKNVECTAEDLKEILRLAVLKQSEIWIKDK